MYGTTLKKFCRSTGKISKHADEEFGRETANDGGPTFRTQGVNRLTEGSESSVDGSPRAPEDYVREVLSRTARVRSL